MKKTTKREWHISVRRHSHALSLLGRAADARACDASSPRRRLEPLLIGTSMSLTSFWKEKLWILMSHETVFLVSLFDVMSKVFAWFCLRRCVIFKRLGWRRRRWDNWLKLNWWWRFAVYFIMLTCWWRFVVAKVIDFGDSRRAGECETVEVRRSRGGTGYVIYKSSPNHLSAA